MNKKYDIIYAPIITEKTASLANENKYAFKVSPKANKTEIKQAIESIFKVKVMSITTSNSHPKKKRVGKYTGMTNKYKRAIVKLAEGQSINFD
ncbi:MAG: 50S ribosomal protein L23 [Bacilli bacterium]|nr:50S ribosomal protein L23 [Clostridium sp.]MDY3798606.1 50S ribosomal protein L23 [Bacilli bacterium]CDE95097.1 50S ribosomal protein L23 [Clostridium sp. CAG:914]